MSFLGDAVDRSKRNTIALLASGAAGAFLSSCGFGSGNNGTANGAPSKDTTQWLKSVEQQVAKLLQSDELPSQLAAGGSALFSESPQKYAELIEMLQKRRPTSPGAEWVAIAHEESTVVGSGALGHLARASLTPSIVRVFMVDSAENSPEAQHVLVVWAVKDREKTRVLAMHP